MRSTFNLQAICICKLKKVHTAMIYEDFLSFVHTLIRVREVVERG